MNISNPHDRLFREIWSDKAVAADFLRHYLPADVLGHIDLNSLEISKDSFIEKELEDYFSDLLYRISLAGEPGYVYLLFEHKSYKDRLAPLQVLEYMPKIWRLHLRQHPKKTLPVIIPMFLYHGQKKWKGSRFSDLMTDASSRFSSYIPDFKYVMIDLSQYSDAQIKGEVLSRAVLLLFRHIFDPDIAEKLPGIFSLMREIAESGENGLRYLETIMRYTFSTVDVSLETVKEIVEKSVSPEKGEMIMTLAERLMKEGYERGVQDATRKGYIKTIDLGLNLKFPDQYQNLMPLVHQIRDSGRLEKIAEAFLSVTHPGELKKLIEQ